jgi:hypothetical protein
LNTQGNGIVALTPQKTVMGQIILILGLKNLEGDQLFLKKLNNYNKLHKFCCGYFININVDLDLRLVLDLKELSPFLEPKCYPAGTVHGHLIIQQNQFSSSSML